MVFLKNHSSEPKIVRMLRSTLLITFAIIVILIIATLTIGIRLEKAKFPPLLGNKPQNIKNIQSSVDPNYFSFVVMGDVKDSTATFESILDTAELENPSFIIILGDLVSHINKIEHKLFAYEIFEYASKTPFIIVPGNHDMSMEDNFTLEDFNQTYGPAQFQFNIGPNLFIFLNDLPQYNQNGQYLDFLENTLQTKNTAIEKTFVFTHIPPGDISDLLDCSAAPDSKRFIDIIEKYNIDYVFASHHHGYIKTIKDDTTYIITGGGGARLRGTKGKFHHFVEVNFEGEEIYESVITVEHKHGSLELSERNIAGYFWDPFKQNKLIYIILFLAYCAATLTALIFLKRKEISKKNT